MKALVLFACGDELASGPAEVKWDRDSCALCAMMISDARFAAQVRGGPKRRAHLFDDIGCALNWLNEKPWAAAAETEIWVADGASTREAMTWLDARKAYYEAGSPSPMNYNFLARATPGNDSIDFEAMANKILAGKPNHVCAIPGQEETK